MFFEGLIYIKIKKKFEILVMNLLLDRQNDALYNEIE